MIRIEQLDLAFFGHFTNKHFDFGEGDSSLPDFHIVYGANEAGKTTFMEAYLRLLYGFLPRNEPYAFRHGRTNLQVSGLLQLDGVSRKFQRNSTARNSLVDELGNVLPEASLQAHLGGLALDDYRKLLCIDDDSIDKGGEEIVNSRGDIGTLLFSAAAGISDLWQVLEAVRTNAEAIHKSRGSKTRLAMLRKEYKDVDKEIKRLDIPAGKLGQFTRALKKAVVAEDKALAEQRRLMVEVRQLERVLNALPMLERLDTSEGLVASMAHYPEHLDVTTQQIIELQKEQHQAKAEQARLRLRQTALAQDIEKLPAEPTFAGLDSVIESISELHSRYRHAELELDSEQQAFSAVSTRMNSLVRERFNAELEAERLVVDTAVIASLQAALSRREEAFKQTGIERDGMEQLDREIERKQSEVHNLEAIEPDGAGLAELLEQFNAEALSSEYKSADRSQREADQKLLEALDVLSIKGQCFSELPECDVLVQEIEVQVERWQMLNATLDVAKERQQIDQQEFNSLVLESSQLESLEGLASDHDTQMLKDSRELAWSSHKQTLTLSTAEAFESVMRDVDKLMDGRLSHASDVARLRDVHRQMPRVKGQLETLAESVRSGEEELQSIDSALSAVMQQVGIKAALPPGAVLSWVRNYHAAKACAHTAARLRTANRPVMEKALKLTEVLSGFIKREQATLTELLPLANTMVEVYKRHDQTLQASQQELARMRSDRESAVGRLEIALAELDKTSKDWDSLVEDTFTVSLDAEKLALSLEALTELREYNVAREASQSLCQQMLRDKALFIEKLDQINRDYGLESGSTPDSSLTKLRELAAQAKKHSDDKTLMEKKLEQTFAEGIEAEKRLEAIQAESQVIAALFHSSIATNDLTELFDAVQKTQQAQMIRSKYEEDRDSLRQALGVSTEEQARAMLAQLDVQTVREEQVAKESELALVNERSREATEKRTRCEEQLAALTGDDEVAKLVELRTTLELQLSEASQEYLKLTLGHRLAEQAIDRYRDKHRSGMLEATEIAFAELTDGKYSTLQTQSDGKEECLLALDSHGNAKRADEMSKGTRFQLYLALRAAAYDQLAEQGTCLPFICDDIFETFDEDRTRAACRVMERIGQRGQAIYLTHHRHVVELAREVCENRVQIHAL